jgi:anti-sigma B factor antagonist
MAIRKPLRLELERVGTATIIRISGSASMEEAYRLQEKLEDLATQRVPLIVLDLGAMDFIASMGLGAIIAGHLRARRYNGEVRLACPSPAVAQLLEMTRLTKLFSVFDSVREALQAPVGNG